MIAHYMTKSTAKYSFLVSIAASRKKKRRYLAATPSHSSSSQTSEYPLIQCSVLPRRRLHGDAESDSTA